MLISKQNLAILPATSKHRENVYSLDCIRIDPVQNCLYASNGHSLYRSNFSRFNDTEYPDTGSAGSDPVEQIIVSAKAMTKAKKNLPSRPSMGILENLNILSTETHHELITTDLDSTDVIKVKNEKLDFPACEEIEKAYSDKSDFTSASLSVADLEILIKILKEHDKTAVVRFSIKDESSPTIIESEDGVLTGYIMPCKFGN